MRVDGVQRLKFLSRFVTSGPRGWGQYYSDTGAVFLRIGNVSRSAIDLLLDNIQHVEPPPSAEGVRTLVQPQDILVSITADIGSVGFVPKGLGEAYINQHLALIRIDQAKAHPRYVAYAAQSPAARRHFEFAMQGGTKLGLGLDDVRDMPLPLPPLPTQKAIAAFLDRKTAAIDALIEKKQKLLDLLAEKRAALINQAVTKGLDPNVPMKDSGIPWIGEIPAHWEVRRISTVSTKITNGYVGPTRGLFVEDGVRYLQSLHIKDNQIRFTPPYFVPEEWSRHKRKSILGKGDVLVVQTGDIGQVAVVPKKWAGANCHALIIVSTIKEAMSGEFLAWALNSPYGFASLKSIQTGALHPHLNCGLVRELPVPCPPILEQREIVGAVQRLVGSERANRLAVETQIERLQEYRQALITAAVTGQLDIGEEAPA